MWRRQVTNDFPGNRQTTPGEKRLIVMLKHVLKLMRLFARMGILHLLHIAELIYKIPYVMFIYLSDLGWMLHALVAYGIIFILGNSCAPWYLGVRNVNSKW